MSVSVDKTRRVMGGKASQSWLGVSFVLHKVTVLMAHCWQSLPQGTHYGWRMCSWRSVTMGILLTRTPLREHQPGYRSPAPLARSSGEAVMRLQGFKPGGPGGWRRSRWWETESLKHPPPWPCEGRGLHLTAFLLHFHICCLTAPGAP